jgi:hypothetical protein
LTAAELVKKFKVLTADVSEELTGSFIKALMMDYDDRYSKHL